MNIYVYIYAYIYIYTYAYIYSCIIHTYSDMHAHKCITMYALLQHNPLVRGHRQTRKHTHAHTYAHMHPQNPRRAHTQRQPILFYPDNPSKRIQRKSNSKNSNPSSLPCRCASSISKIEMAKSHMGPRVDIFTLFADLTVVRTCLLQAPQRERERENARARERERARERGVKAERKRESARERESEGLCMTDRGTESERERETEQEGESARSREGISCRLLDV